MKNTSPIYRKHQFERLKLLSEEFNPKKPTTQTKSPETGPEEADVRSNDNYFSLDSEEERILDNSLFFTCERLKNMQEEQSRLYSDQ